MEKREPRNQFSLDDDLGDDDEDLDMPAALLPNARPNSMSSTSHSDYDFDEEDEDSLSGLASRSKKDKKGHMEKYTIPEISSEDEWLYLTGQVRPSLGSKQPFHAIKPKQILLIDIYSSWSGPCSAMEGHLRRMRHQFVETPDCLALAKACCDNIDVLKPFKSDPRPTFLFWARGRPVALLRGANRPLLTRLVEQEVGVEVNETPREEIDIDFKSRRVIQCEGKLADLDDDEVVHSIGSGCTERLTTFFQEPQMSSKRRSPRDNKGRHTAPTEADNTSTENNQTEEQENSAPDSSKEQENEEANGEAIENNNEQEGEEPNESPEAVENGAENGTDGVNSEENDNDENEESEPGNDAEQNDSGEEKPAPVAEVSVNEGFGVKKPKKSKKMETGLLKEILDAKPSKRYGH